MKVLYWVLLITLLTKSYTGIAQQGYNNKLFLETDNPGEIFTDVDSLMIIDKMYIHNFPDNKSAKYLHFKINSINNVKSFGIASSSEEYKDQRRFYIKIYKKNYLNTFKKVLNAIPVDYIIVKGEQISISEFIKDQ